MIKLPEKTLNSTASATSTESRDRQSMADLSIQRITLEKCTSISHKNRKSTFVAKDGERVVGFVGYGEYRDGSMTDCGELYALYVLRECHGKKVGFELMNAAIAALSHCNIVALWALKGNDRAIRFYEKYGFAFDGTEKEITLGTLNVERRMVYKQK